MWAIDGFWTGIAGENNSTDNLSVQGVGGHYIAWEMNVHNEDDPKNDKCNRLEKFWNLGSCTID